MYQTTRIDQAVMQIVPAHTKEETRQHGTLADHLVQLRIHQGVIATLIEERILNLLGQAISLEVNIRALQHGRLLVRLEVRIKFLLGTILNQLHQEA